jgi:hypothetical protein
MYDDDSIDWTSRRIDNSRPPLRWFANAFGAIASNALMRSSWAQEDGKDKGFRYWLDGKIWKYFWPVYYKYGTFYKMDINNKEEEY